MRHKDLFSNLASIPIVIDGEIWASTEHFYQAAKFLDGDIVNRIRSAKSSLQSAILGQTRNYRIRDDWENVKVSIMERGIRARFDQHMELRQALMASNGVLYDATSVDDFWGIGFDGKGANVTGKILMKLRDEYLAITDYGEKYMKTVQQVDSAEASTIAVPPFDPSGSPR